LSIFIRAFTKPLYMPTIQSASITTMPMMIQSIIVKIFYRFEFLKESIASIGAM